MWDLETGLAHSEALWVLTFSEIGMTGSQVATFSNEGASVTLVVLMVNVEKEMGRKT